MKKIFINIGIIVLYVILISMITYIATIDLSEFNNSYNSEGVQTGGSVINMGMSDSVTVSVKRIRWYGEINEFDNRVYLDLFKIVRIPIKVNGFNLLILHIVFFSMLIAGNLVIFIVRRYEKENETYLQKDINIPPN